MQTINMLSVSFSLSSEAMSPCMDEWISLYMHKFVLTIHNQIEPLDCIYSKMVKS